MSKVFDWLIEIFSGTFRWANPVLWLLAGIALILLLTTVSGVIRKIQRRHQHKLFRLGLHDIGELAVEEADTTVIYYDKDARQLFGWDVPLTNRRRIITCDFRLKVGYDFDQIAAVVNEKRKEISLSVPAAKFISRETLINDGHKKTIDEYYAFFARKPREEDYDRSLRIMLKEAEQKAIESGIFARAENSMRNRMHAFMAQFYDMRKYKLVFTFAPNGFSRLANRDDNTPENTVSQENEAIEA